SVRAFRDTHDHVRMHHACPQVYLDLFHCEAESGLHQSRHQPSARLTAPIVSFTASADFLRAACSSGESFTSRICSNPRRPSLQGTPQYMPDNPYSPWSHAAQGRTRFLSSTIASTICVTAAEGA